MTTSRRFATRCLAVISVASCALAGEVVHSTSIVDLPIGGAGTVALPQFDATIGYLQYVRVGISISVSGTARYENTTAGAVSFGGAGSNHFAGARVDWGVGATIPPPDLYTIFLLPAVVLPAYDGVTDFGGASGVTYAFTDVSSGGYLGELFFYPDPAFQGAGTFSVDVLDVFLNANAPAALTSQLDLTVDAVITVRYEFWPFPAAICRTAEFTGCPCGNFSPVSYGCANSANVLGASMATLGTASIANDTLTLGAGGMTNSNSLFFQGTSTDYWQIPYGDGMRCVTGNIRRLGVRNNVGGIAQIPEAGGTPISVRGQVTQPGTRYYQVFYRDAQSYCTSATYNVSSGLAILWTL